MKKILILGLVFGAFLFQSIGVKAQQTKIGSFDEESVLGLFPNIKPQLDTFINTYYNDSLRLAYEYNLDEYHRIDSTFKHDSATMNPSKKSFLQQQLAQAFYKIQNWQTYQQEQITRKQNEFLQPYREKIYKALQEIIISEKYVYVLDTKAFIAPVPIQDNLSLKVAQRLKLALPADVEDALKKAEGGSGAPVRHSTTHPKGGR